MAQSSQKFIARNRAPRVRGEYDVDLYGAEKRVHRSFFMGVLADLSGRSEGALYTVSAPKILDINDFESRIAVILPRAAASPSTSSGWSATGFDPSKRVSPWSAGYCNGSTATAIRIPPFVGFDHCPEAPPLGRGTHRGSWGAIRDTAWRTRSCVLTTSSTASTSQCA